MDRLPRRHSIPLVMLLLSLLAPSPARADWVNLTGAENARNIAEIHVEEDRVRLILEIFVQDLPAFFWILPEEMFEGTDIKIPPLEERLRRFSEETFRFISDTGENLRAELILVEPRKREERYSPYAGVINPATMRPVPGPPEDKRVMYAELVYPFSGKPGSLTIIPPLDERGVPEVSIGFITYHMEVPVIDFRFLSEEAGLTLDWEDPWYSSFDNKGLKRWQQSGVMSFLYIEPYEVRHEIMVRVKEMEAWMDLGLTGDEYIEEDEFDHLRQRIGEYLLSREKVLIDGESLRPILDRTAFVKRTITRTYFLDKPERMRLPTAMMGVIITYLTDGIPRKITAELDLFSDRIQKIPTSSIDPAGPFPSYATPDDNVHGWVNYLKTYTIPAVEGVEAANSLTSVSFPLGSFLCLLGLIPVAWVTLRRKSAVSPGLIYGLGGTLLAGSLLLLPHFRVPVTRPTSVAARIEGEQATAILNDLLKNVYRAFDFREEEDVYDKLAVSVSGDLLTDIYLQNRRSMVVTQAGGAQAKVKAVEIEEAKVEPHPDNPRALYYRSQWTAMGTVGHWGHIHTRQNRYSANITVEPVRGSWKITGLELLEEKRIDPYASMQPPASGGDGG